MQTRSSVLGKRHAPSETTSTAPSSPSSSSSCDPTILPTPDTTPSSKRIRYSSTMAGGDGNKENIPPLRVDPLSAPPTPTSPRVSRTLRRSSTEHFKSPRAASSLRRTASVSSGVLPITPASALSHLTLVTPPSTPPLALQPISSRVRATLRSACVAGVTGRQTERDTITRFITRFISPESEPKASEDSYADASVLYISGTPGTGKTVLVNSVVVALSEQLSAVRTNVITINCMALNDVEALYTRLHEELSRGPSTPKKRKGQKGKGTSVDGVDILLGVEDVKCLVILDEVDHIASNMQALKSIFTLAQKHSSSLRIIGIANTHTLSSSTTATSASVQTLACVKTMHFAPYTPEQLLEIIDTRLAPLRDSLQLGDESLAKFLPRPALMLLTKKVAAMTGDARAVFEVLRGAIDIALNSSRAPTNSSINPLECSVPPVTPAHVLSALKAYNPAKATSTPLPNPGTAPSATRKGSDSETVVKVRELGLQARLVLLAAVLARKRLDVGLTVSGSSSPSPSATPRTPTKRSQAASPVSSAMDAGQLHTYYRNMLERAEQAAFTAVSRSEFGDILGMLETVGILELSSAGGLPRTPSKSAKRGLSRAPSFGGMKPMTGGPDVQFVDGVRMDEICRGLGIRLDKAISKPTQEKDDVLEEEVRAIYERERVRLAREVKTKNPAGPVTDAFEGAIEG